MSDLREQIANEVHHSKPTHNGCSGCNRTGDAVWTNAVGPALDAKDARIAELEARVDRFKKQRAGWSGISDLRAEANEYEAERDRLKAEILRLSERLRLRQEQAEVTIARVEALIEVWKARGYAMYEGCADELTWALIRPDDQPKDT